MSFSCCTILPRKYIYLLLSLLLSSSSSVFVFEALSLLKNIYQLFCLMFLNLGLSFSHWTEVMLFGRLSQTCSCVLSPSYHKIPNVNILLVMLTLNTWLRWLLSGFSIVKLINIYLGGDTLRSRKLFLLTLIHLF